MQSLALKLFRCSSIFLLLFLFGSSCESTRSAGPSLDSTHDGTLETRDENRPPPDEPVTATLAPEARALQYYTEGIEGDGPLRAHIHTNLGVIQCELYEEKAPVTVANFVGLSRGIKAYIDPFSGDVITDQPYYDGTIFHRVIPKFLIHGGDPTGTGYGGPGYTLPDEYHPQLRHDRPGRLSMANRGPATGGSQFFILEGPAPHLDDRHTIFGQCDSVQVLRAISHVPTSTMGRPVAPEPRIEKILFFR